MATAASISTDRTTCPICLELFDNPKGLPCFHAFCLKCLQRQFNDKSPGDEASCPMCRKDFRIPPDGLGGLQHHFYVQEMMDERNMRPDSNCDKHGDKQVELYCHDCNENFCLTCLTAVHRSHNYGEIREVADSFRQSINDDDERIVSAISCVQEQSGQTTRSEEEFLSKVEDVKKIVLATGDLVKRPVDDQIADVLTKLQSVTSESTDQAKNVQETFQLALVSLESFHTHSQELLDKGRPSDVTRAAHELHERAQELLNNDVTAVEYHPPHVTFTPADVPQIKCQTLIGKLAITTNEQSGRSYLLYSYCQSFTPSILVFQTFYKVNLKIPHCATPIVIACKIIEMSLFLWRHIVQCALGLLLFVFVLFTWMYIELPGVRFLIGQSGFFGDLSGKKAEIKPDKHLSGF